MAGLLTVGKVVIQMAWVNAASHSLHEMLYQDRSAFRQGFQMFRTIQAGGSSSYDQVLDGEGQLSEEGYREALDLIIRDLVTRKATFQKISQSCKGAWPGLIANQITKLGLRPSIASEAVITATPSYVPELHCGFGEWYFSDESARNLASEFISPNKFSLLLGSPTIAQIAFKRGADFALVDSNPFVNLRFPDLKGRLHYSAVEQLNGTFPNPSAIFFDAPWYLPRILYWLAKSSQLASKHSIIAMPLFPSMTRPAAAAERRVILRVAASIGRVELVPDCIAYDAPLYETEALAAQSICAHPNWRRADLLIVRNPSPIALPELDQADFQEMWENFLIGSQVVRLRLHPLPRKKRSLIAPVQGTAGYVFDTVSARDPRRKQIDLWTSRNRVAVVGDIRRMRYVLSILENSTQDMRTALRTLLPHSEASTLSQLLAFATFH
jgi:hypothetical protein